MKIIKAKVNDKQLKILKDNDIEFEIIDRIFSLTKEGKEAIGEYGY